MSAGGCYDRAFGSLTGYLEERGRCYIEKLTARPNRICGAQCVHPNMSASAETPAREPLLEWCVLEPCATSWTYPALCFWGTKPHVSINQVSEASLTVMCNCPYPVAFPNTQTQVVLWTAQSWCLQVILCSRPLRVRRDPCLWLALI